MPALPCRLIHCEEHPPRISEISLPPALQRSPDEDVADVCATYRTHTAHSQRIPVRLLWL